MFGYLSVLKGDCCVICNLFVTTDEEMLRVLSLVSSTLQLAVCQLSVAPRHPNYYYNNYNYYYHNHDHRKKYYVKKAPKEEAKDCKRYIRYLNV